MKSGQTYNTIELNWSPDKRYYYLTIKTINKLLIIMMNEYITFYVICNRHIYTLQKCASDQKIKLKKYWNSFMPTHVTLMYNLYVKLNHIGTLDLYLNA